MGLGKTLQTISFLGYLKFVKKLPGPHLIIVPLATLGNWINEFARWCPAFKIMRFHALKDQREKLRNEILESDGVDVIITSYEMVIAEKSLLKRIPYRYIVIDEAHRIKNDQSLLSQVVRTFRSNNRFLMT
eukprot:TRINITY_DN1584_c0_g1_i1.p1 TRINITY_DN1584_c0_g1~~TRINITY_DN1584_c0_g1_i1.p1  ORF type:complete len:131 (+),score=30.13 TRINITY_DN1584_c0_g1_i1:247-639(+)